jgi:putative membrane protein
MVGARSEQVTMNAVAQLSAGISALILIAVFPFEAFFIDRPAVQRFLEIEPHDIRNVHLWSFSVGTRNALAGVGALIGLGMVNFGNETVGVTVVVVACIYMLVTSLSMGLSDALGFWRPRGGSVKGTVASSVLPAVALIAIAVG